VEALSVGTMMVAIALGPVAAGADAATSTPIVLQVRDTSDLHRDTLDRAREVVDRTFLAVGARIIWRLQSPSSEEGPQGLLLTVVICSRAVTETFDVSPTTLGVAPGSPAKQGRRAYVFYDRIQGFARAHGLAVGPLLGHVIAHEVGHLLLPFGSHSSSGLMRGRWTPVDLRRNTRGGMAFTADQAGLIRAQVATTDSVLAAR